jgi:hypothetical protein
MVLRLEGSCRCGAVRFSVDSHAPYPYQRCYCSICRKTAGGGGYAINLHADSATLTVTGAKAIGIYRAEVERDGQCELSTGERNACKRCASALWLYDPTWPDLLHPFASAVDTPLPVPPERVHMMLRFKAPWVQPDIRPGDRCFEDYPEQSIEDWHRSRNLWIA